MIVILKIINLFDFYFKKEKIYDFENDDIENANEKNFKNKLFEKYLDKIIQVNKSSKSNLLENTIIEDEEKENDLKENEKTRNEKYKKSYSEINLEKQTNFEASRLIRI